MVRKVVVNNIYKIYQSGSLQQKLETVALRGINFDIRDEDFITVMGPSGSGKTTSLNLLGGLDQPSAGSIKYRNGTEAIDIAKLSSAELDQWRHDKVGIIFQSDNILHHLTALENVQLPLKFLGKQNGKRAEDLLCRLGLEERLNHKTYQLSAGERQRVALAAAIIFKPIIVLADEPTGELDSETLRKTMKIFQELHEEEGIAFFVVTHNPSVAAYGNRYFTLEDGILNERDKPFSYDDFASSVGEYIVHIDKLNRLLIPHDMIREFKPEEGLVGLTLSDDKANPNLIISKNVEEADNVAQIDQNFRILLPKSFRNIFRDKLLGWIEYETEEIILRRSEQ